MHGLELAGKPDSSIELDRDDGDIARRRSAAMPAVVLHSLLFQ
jgi:hypothetical protein